MAVWPDIVSILSPITSLYAKCTLAEPERNRLLVMTSAEVRQSETTVGCKMPWPPIA
jgi:hypothetical protein